MPPKKMGFDITSETMLELQKSKLYKQTSTMPNAGEEFRRVQERHRAVEKAAYEQLEAIKANLAFAIDELTGWDDGQFYLRTGINLPGMVETFVKGTTNSGTRGVVHLIYALGLRLCDVERSPADFRKWWIEHRRDPEKRAR